MSTPLLSNCLARTPIILAFYQTVWQSKGIMLNTASGQAKEYGAKSLSWVSRASGVSRQTLTNWFNNKPALFRCVCLGSLAMESECNQ